MKKLFFVAFALCVSLNTFAQIPNEYVELAREVLQAEKKEIIEASVEISSDKSDAFWNLYDEYQTQLHEVNDGSIAIIERLFNVEEKITDEEADHIWLSYHKHAQSTLNLQKKYYKKFKKILPPSETARYFQIENKIAALINARIVMEVPLIEK